MNKTVQYNFKLGRFLNFFAPSPNNKPYYMNHKDMKEYFLQESIRKIHRNINFP